MSVLNIAADIANVAASFGGMLLVFIVFATARPGSNFESSGRKRARVASLIPSWLALVLIIGAVALALFGKVAESGQVVWCAIGLLAISAIIVAGLALRLALSPED